MKLYLKKIFVVFTTIVFSITSSVVYAETPQINTVRIDQNRTFMKVDQVPITSFREDTNQELTGFLEKYIQEEVIPKESIYFQPGIGIDELTGMPFDHVRIRFKKGILGEVGNYTAASKLSLYIPYLLGLIQQKPVLRQAKLRLDQAEPLLIKTLETINKYIKDYPDYGAFMPWMDIRPDGTIAPASTKMPSLDNGQLTWALAAVVSTFENSPLESRRNIAELAQSILDRQNYAMFYDAQTGLLHGTIQMNPDTAIWTGDKSYYLNDMFEGTLAVLWAVLHGQVPEEAWYNLAIPTADYVSMNNEKITTFQGFRASFHEHWALGFLPFMKSSLAPLYRNYLYVQADHARRQKLPGFVSTAYDAKGTYRQMGIPEISYRAVDRSDVSVVFATAMGMLISPYVGAMWLQKIYGFKNIVSAYGAVESVGPDGYADIFTADAKGMTLLAATGGVVPEVQRYLKRRKVPGTNISMEAKLFELLQGKFKQLMEQRDQEPFYEPTSTYPLPPDVTINVEQLKPNDPGETFNVNNALQNGHLHGKNVQSINEKTLEDDVRQGQPFGFEYYIPPNFPYFDQWAFRGTYLNTPVSIARMRYMLVDIPADSLPHLFEIELKSDDIRLATIMMDTTENGYLSSDGKWKTIVKKINVIPESVDKPFNYFSVAVHDPSYLLRKFTPNGRKGVVQLKNLRLSQHPPVVDGNVLAPTVGVGHNASQFELLNYWRLSHGNLKFNASDDKAHAFHFEGDRGWKGGYLPYTDLRNFRYLILKIRNTSGQPNRVLLELKNEKNYVIGSKIPIELPKNSDWYYVKIEVPRYAEEPLNYFALSDPTGDFELSSFSGEYADQSDEKIDAVYFSNLPEFRGIRHRAMMAAPNAPKVIMTKVSAAS